MKMFVVDDELDMVSVMTLLLQHAGHEVESSVAGSTAIPKIRAFRPDVLLTDLVMAEVNGLELCQELRGDANLADLKIIFVSGKDDPYWHDQAKAVGALGFIGKPLDPDAFANQVVALVEGAE